jgi:hypothetical protein
MMASTLLPWGAMRFRWLWLGALAVGCLLNPQPDLPQGARESGSGASGGNSSGGALNLPGTGGSGIAIGDPDAGEMTPPDGAECPSGGAAGAAEAAGGADDCVPAGGQGGAGGEGGTAGDGSLGIAGAGLK